jgi:hypothetical protein
MSRVARLKGGNPSQSGRRIQRAPGRSDAAEPGDVGPRRRGFVVGYGSWWMERRMQKYTIGDRVNKLRERRQNDEILRSHVRIGELERMVAYLLARMIQGRSVTLDDEQVRRFLRIPSDAKDDSQSCLQAALSVLEPIGLLECKACGSEVEDLPGFVDETCPICGEHIGSED